MVEQEFGFNAEASLQLNGVSFNIQTKAVVSVKFG